MNALCLWGGIKLEYQGHPPVLLLLCDIFSEFFIIMMHNQKDRNLIEHLLIIHFVRILELIEGGGGGYTLYGTQRTRVQIFSFYKQNYTFIHSYPIQFINF